MRSEENPLDLNNLPEDYTKDGKQVLEESSSFSVCRKKKSGGKDGKEECGKVYECRFCSLKFCKSQALGGHMNRHRQERETETLNRARQLVFSNDNMLVAQGPPHPHLGGQPIPQGGYHQTGGNIGGDPTQAFKSSAYPTRLFSVGGSSTPPASGGGAQPPSQLYSSPSSRLVSGFPSQFNPLMNHHHDYFVGHVLPAGINNLVSAAAQQESNVYTCIGAPVQLGSFPQIASTNGISNNNNNNIISASGGGRTSGVSGGSMEMSLYNDDLQGLSWARAGRSQQRLDPSLINRFQDGF